MPLIIGALMLTPKLRKGLCQKLALQPIKIPAKTRKRLWIHCVSVGELNAATPLIKAVENDWDVVISTSTATAQALAKTRYLQVFYCPLDYFWSVKYAFKQLQPDKLIVMETELWPNLFYQGAKFCQQGVWVVNARLSDSSFKGYSRFEFFMRWLLSLPSGVLTQSDLDEDRFRALGAKFVQTMGNLKFDINPIVDEKWVAHFKHRVSASRIVVFASTHANEEALLMPVVKQLAENSDICVVLAPRHPERGQAVSDVLTAHQLAFVQQSIDPQASVMPGQVLLLDTIGQLLSVYSISDLAVIGGSFVPHGGQNPLEPLALGVPVITGPYMHNFKAMIATLKDCLTQLNNPDELQVAIEQWLIDRNIYSDLMQNLETKLQSSQGATQRALALMSN